MWSLKESLSMRWHLSDNILYNISSCNYLLNTNYTAESAEGAEHVFGFKEQMSSFGTKLFISLQNEVNLIVCCWALGLKPEAAAVTTKHTHRHTTPFPDSESGADLGQSQ